MSNLSILHFNDVYRVAPQKLSPTSNDTIDVTQFAALLDDLRNAWPVSNGAREGLILFSGDLFSPSVESSVTRGSHLVPVINELGPDVALTGNHDFDFGYPHLSKLIGDTKFPWILSNIVDRTTSQTPAHLKEFVVFKRSGLQIGVIGLVEEEWIATVATWPPDFEYKSMKETGFELSKRLRNPNGDYRCDIIIALTHSRIPNDITLAKELFALSPKEQKNTPIATVHGVDLILGGHDHLYYVSNGVDAWEDFDVNQNVLGAEKDIGDILLVKSGNDFRDLSEINLELEAAPAGSVRNKIIKKITGKRHITKAGSRSSQTMAVILKKIFSSVSLTLTAPVCNSTVTLDVRSQYIRTSESAAANWFADIIRHAFDDALCMQGCGGSDGVLICAGTLRGDSTYGPGFIRLGDILEILPFEDPIVVLELDGASLWDALEASLAKWPAQEGRFPVVSGFKVSWDSRREPGNRVLAIWLSEDLEEGENDHDFPLLPKVHITETPILRETSGRKYKIVTRDYMAQGHDGFTALTGHKFLIDHEGGQLMSAIVRKYLLGSQFVGKMIRIKEQSDLTELHLLTRIAIAQEHKRRKWEQNRETTESTEHWKSAINKALALSRRHYHSQLAVCATEDMSSVDVFDGDSTRRGQECILQQDKDEDKGDLLVVSPQIDGRLKDVGRG